MKKIISDVVICLIIVIVVIIILFIVSFAITGPTNAEVEHKQQVQEEKLNQRFIILTKEYNDKDTNYPLGYIVYDKETMIEYYISGGYKNTGTLTVLLNDKGMPLKYKGGE